MNETAPPILKQSSQLSLAGHAARADVNTHQSEIKEHLRNYVGVVGSQSLSDAIKDVEVKLRSLNKGKRILKSNPRGGDSIIPEYIDSFPLAAE